MTTGRLLHLFGHLLTGKFTVKSVTEIDGRRVRVCVAAPTQKDPRGVMERVLQSNPSVNYWLAEYCDHDFELGTYFVFTSKQ